MILSLTLCNLHHIQRVRYRVRTRVRIVAISGQPTIPTIRAILADFGGKRSKRSDFGQKTTKTMTVCDALPATRQYSCELLNSHLIRLNTFIQTFQIIKYKVI